MEGGTLRKARVCASSVACSTLTATSCTPPRSPRYTCSSSNASSGQANAVTGALGNSCSVKLKRACLLSKRTSGVSVLIEESVIRASCQQVAKSVMQNGLMAAEWLGRSGSVSAVRAKHTRP